MLHARLLFHSYELTLLYYDGFSGEMFSATLCLFEYENRRQKEERMVSNYPDNTS